MITGILTKDILIVEIIQIKISIIGTENENPLFPNKDSLLVYADNLKRQDFVSLTKIVTTLILYLDNLKTNSPNLEKVEEITSNLTMNRFLEHLKNRKFVKILFNSEYVRIGIVKIPTNLQQMTIYSF